MALKASIRETEGAKAGQPVSIQGEREWAVASSLDSPSLKEPGTLSIEETQSPLPEQGLGLVDLFWMPFLWLPVLVRTCS